MQNPAPIVVREVQTRRDRQRFIDFPYSHYQQSHCWVPPLRLFETQMLNSNKNAFFEHGEIGLFLALNGDDRVLGRIAAIKNGRHLERYRDYTGFFGFFESVDDFEVFSLLFDSASAWLTKRGLKIMRGPASPSMNDLSGLLVKGFDSEPSFFMPYNFEYYEKNILRYGFSRAMSMSAFFIHKKFLTLTRALPALEAVYRYHPTMTVRTLNRRRILEEVRTVVEIHNDAFADNWGHVPLSHAEFADLAKLFKYFLDPDMVLFLELDNIPVGFTVCLPNFNEIIRFLKNGRLFPLGWINLLARRRLGGIHTVRSALTGVLKAHRGNGFDAVLCYEGAKRGMEKGYHGCELSWVLETNRVVVNSLESIGAIRDKEYAMFEKPIGAAPLAF